MMAVATTETKILIANEYINGANLQQILHTEITLKLQQEDKLFVALDLAMAVEYIHGKKIIHQDLKPANIMVAAENKKAYLTDWGLANLLETVTMTSGSSHMGASCGPLGGTPQYMAPECLVECNKCSTMSDTWSLGITLLEMFTASKPWSYSSLQEMRKLLYNKTTPQAMSKLQQPLHDIVKPLLQYDPESRMETKDLIALLKTKVDITKRYGHGW
ncbi:RAC family serine/threonine-protein kinase homolog [Engraulis encrasicolus]|uniref:RAC family serine/threonine-protein kinase homolog n=1 Tax=Engraulis encrasicolus TaxID=184585 RepID=UPI002FD1FC18